MSQSQFARSSTSVLPVLIRPVPPSAPVPP
jgi:hypothetical protein